MITDRLSKMPHQFWLDSDHFTAKRMEGGYIRISVKDSRYCFMNDNEIDEVIELLQAVKKEVVE